MKNGKQILFALRCLVYFRVRTRYIYKERVWENGWNFVVIANPIFSKQNYKFSNYRQ